MPQCWCGISTTEERPCVFHGGDLRERVEAILREVTVYDTETGEDLKPAQAWIALCAAWRGDSERRPIRSLVDGTSAQFVIGDVAIRGNPWCDASDALGTNKGNTERQALLGEAIMGRWPW